MGKPCIDCIDQSTYRFCTRHLLKTRLGRSSCERRFCLLKVKTCDPHVDEQPTPLPGVPPLTPSESRTPRQLHPPDSVSESLPRKSGLVPFPDVPRPRTRLYVPPKCVPGKISHTKRLRKEPSKSELGVTFPRRFCTGSTFLHKDSNFIEGINHYALK